MTRASIVLWVAFLAFVAGLMTGCDDSKSREKCMGDLDKCLLIDRDNLERLDNSCSKLAKCMSAEYEIVEFKNQSHRPYACSISLKDKGVPRAHYFYPMGDISFGQVHFNDLEEAITTCEMINASGNKSKKYYDNLREAFKKMDEHRAKLNAPPKPKPTVKVRIQE